MMRRFGGALLLAAMTMLFAAGPVAAETGYPPGATPTTTTPCSAEAGGDLGSAHPGGVIGANVGGCFGVNSGVTVVVDGTSVCTTNADGSGYVQFHVSILTESLVSVSCPAGGAGSNAAAHCGANSYTVSGTDRNGRTSTASGTFEILCSIAASGSTGGASNEAAVLASNLSASGTPGGRSSGALAFTGAEIVGLVLLALLLIAVGTVLVIAARRRATHA